MEEKNENSLKISLMCILQHQLEMWDMENFLCNVKTSLENNVDIKLQQKN